MIDQHGVFIAAPGALELTPESGRVRLDESWSPYVQGTLVCPLPDDLATLDLIDPRDPEPHYLGVGVQRDFGVVWSNADFTAAHPIPATNAQLSAAYPAWTNAQITAQFFEPWNPFGVRDSQRFDAELVVRARKIDHLKKIVTIELASDESLLQDESLLAAEKYTNTATTGRALVNFILQRIGATLEPGAFDFSLAASSTEWLPGRDAYSYLMPVIEANGGRLWADETRRWYLTEREPAADGNLVLSAGANGNLVSAEDDIDRDDEEFYNSVVVEYRWVDDTGATQIAWDFAGTEGPTALITREQPYPGPGAADSILSRAKGRGRVLPLRAISDYDARPAQAFSASLPDTVVQTGVVAAIEFDLAKFEMDVVTRGLIDTPSTAWIFDPPGVAWNAIPVGIDWTEDI